MDPREQRAIVERYWAAMQTNDWRAAAELLHEEYVLEWPQSGEIVRWREHFVAIIANYPTAGRWHFTINRIVAGEGGVVSDVGVTDGAIVARAIIFSTIRDGTIAHQTEFWPDPTEPHAWRAQWVERTDSQQQTFTESVEEGLHDFEAGRVIEHSDVTRLMDTRRQRLTDSTG